MRGFKFPREWYIPKGATKIADKLSDAVAYLSMAGHRPCATIFFGKQAKPVSNCTYKDTARRDIAVANAFESRRKSMAFKVEMRSKRTSWVPDYKVGEILSTCWGYDQTNIEYFEVTEVKGKYVTVREIAQDTRQDGFMSGKCVPLPGQYLKPRFEGDEAGLPLRRLAQETGIRICKVRWASRIKPQLVGSVPVYSPASYSWGH